jgi:hypothetical protein
VTRTTHERSTHVEQRFHQLDDLILELKGLVLVRGLREGAGADAEELNMYRAEIDRVRDRVANLVRPAREESAAA